jgi:class 3 adenylate cyclase/tetratricopeptide (TPR) repeat protein
MRCTKCDTENRHKAKFCDKCGARLSLKCASCGVENRSDAKFCSECGTSLVDAGKAPVEENPTMPVGSTVGERRHLTILFCDVVGSVGLTSKLDPEEWRATVAQYQRTASDAISRFDGAVVRYVGDGIMAFFGYPIAHDNDAERAARAGLAILETVALLKPQLSVRIGIDSGPVVVGVCAGAALDAFGDAANIAARVQASAPSDTVVVSGATHRLISGLFVVEAHGAQQLKGIERPIELYRIVGPSGARDRFEAAAAGGSLVPFIGREEELNLLLSRWARARDGEGQVVTISGEAGIGKSRLIRRFREESTPSPHLWLQAGAGVFFQSTPFYPVAELIRQLTDMGGSADPILPLESALRAVALDPAEAVPLLAPLLNLPPSSDYPPSPMPPKQQRRRSLATLVEWLLRAARDRPLVVVIEDLHWIDPSTLELIQLLVEQGATAPLLLLYTARPEFRPPWPQRAHHLQLTLNRLSARDVRMIVGAVAADRALADETITTLVERTGGVPLFVEELTRAVLEGGDGAGSDARAIPATLHDSLMARLDRLGDAKEVLQMGAVLGSEFSYELLRAVLQVHDQKLQEGLRSLTDAELLYVRGLPPDASYQFKHALIREAAYEALLKSRRRELHLVVARCIDAEFPSIKETHPEVLARHWTEGGEHEPAIAAWQEAGERALRREANREAIQHYRAALNLLPTIDDVRRGALLYPLGLAQRRAGEAIPAHESLHRSGEIAARLGNPAMVADAALEMARLTFHLGLPVEDAVQLLERALDMVERTDNTLRARILSGLGTMLGVTGQRERALAFGEQGIAMSRRMGDTGTLISGLSAVVHSLQEPQDLDRRLACVKEILELGASQSGPQLFELAEQLLEIQSHFCVDLHEAGDLVRSDAEFEAWTKIGDTLTRPFHKSVAVGRAATRALMRGDFEQSQKFAQEALAISQQIRADSAAAGVYGLQMFALERERGRLKELEPLVRMFVDQNLAADTWRPGLAVIYSELDRPVEARAEFERLASHNFKDIPRDALWMGTMTFIADVCVFLGDKLRATILYDQLSPFDGRNVIIAYEIVAYGALSRYLGALATTLERWEEAFRHFEDALAMNGRMEAWTWLAHTQYQYAAMLFKRLEPGDRDRAFALLDSAQVTAQRLGMNALVEKIAKLS